MKYEIVKPFAWYKKGQVFEVEEPDAWVSFLENLGMIKQIKEG